MNIPVKNLIFDLGGVILDLSADRTIQAFAALAKLEKELVVQKYLASEEFDQYEKGLITDDEFRNFVRKLYGIQAADAEIDACWNAMLLGFPKKNLALLSQLKKQYNIFLLSNTNTIHLNYINQILLAGTLNVNSLDRYFHHAYYSHEMKMRKPEPEIFIRVLQENNLSPAETLFLDDNAGNVESAKAVGLQTIHVTRTDFIIEYFR